MKLNIRRLNKKEDLKIIEEWWEAWPEWTSPGADFLPDTGVVVTADDKMIMAAFIYLTNAKVALLEWIISDPEYREDNRKQALELLITGGEEIIKSLGYGFTFSMCRNKNLGETYKKLGWHKDEEPSFEFVKILNK